MSSGPIDNSGSVNKANAISQTGAVSAKASEGISKVNDVIAGVADSSPSKAAVETMATFAKV
ncbi:MAG: hypothetical protein OXU45_00170 [Candidatus Melainabacteria bacterium]|nr:hypothetical protein [Candidatus Melainabacteria bacterium]